MEVIGPQEGVEHYVELRNILERACGNGERFIVIHFVDSQPIFSEFVNFLFQIRKKLETEKGPYDTAVIQPSSGIREVVEAAELQKAIPIYSSLEEFEKAVKK